MTIKSSDGNRQLAEYLGYYESCFSGYSNDDTIRDHAASGGIVSGLLIYLLERKLINAALVCRALIKEERLHYEIRLARTKDEVLECASSVYYNIPLLTALDTVRAFDGNVAVVGLPCHLTGIQQAIKNDPDLRNKIKYKIGLFCGGNCDSILLETVFAKKGIPIHDIERFVFRRGHVSGEILITLKDGTVRSIPFLQYNVYRILGFFGYGACKHCSDFTGENSDISVGDIFLQEYKKMAIKHSAIICRSQSATELLDAMHTNNVIEIRKISPDKIVESQKNGLNFKKNTSSKMLAGKILGIRINASHKGKIRWNLVLASVLYLLNGKISGSPKCVRILFTIPPFLLYPYVYFFKLLTRF